mmetsp:Transcript_10701/g.25377  ORF Transcript_10701/g.25377 Transcript_10701/m.25377 type:complete len:286 (-) Transcript_10701:128-985(-)
MKTATNQSLAGNPDLRRKWLMRRLVEVAEVSAGRNAVLSVAGQAGSLQVVQQPPGRGERGARPTRRGRRSSWRGAARQRAAHRPTPRSVRSGSLVSWSRRMALRSPAAQRKRAAASGSRGSPYVLATELPPDRPKEARRATRTLSSSLTGVCSSPSQTWQTARCGSWRLPSRGRSTCRTRTSGGRTLRGLRPPLRSSRRRWCSPSSTLSSSRGSSHRGRASSCTGRLGPARRSSPRRSPPNAGPPSSTSLPRRSSPSGEATARSWCGCSSRWPDTTRLPRSSSTR